jgi:hypothetical protein
LLLGFLNIVIGIFLLCLFCRDYELSFARVLVVVHHRKFGDIYLISPPAQFHVAVSVVIFKFPII